VVVNYIGVDVLRLRTLNRERAEVLLASVVEGVAEDFLSFGMKSDESENGSISDATFVVPKPEEVHESLYQSVLTLLFPKRCSVELGARFHPDCCKAEYRPMLQLLIGERYLLRTEQRDNAKWAFSVKVVLLYGAKEMDEWRALVHAKILHRTLQKVQDSNGGIVQNKLEYHYQLMEWSYNWVRSLTSADGGVLHLNSLARLGWECDRLYFCSGRWRVAFENEKND